MSETILGEVSLEEFTESDLELLPSDHFQEKVKEILKKNKKTKFVHMANTNKKKLDYSVFCKTEVKINEFIYNGNIFLNKKHLPLFYPKGDTKCYNITEIFFLDGIKKKDEDLLLKKIKENYKYLHVRIK